MVKKTKDKIKDETIDKETERIRAEIADDMFDNLKRTLGVLKGTSTVVVDWIKDIGETIKLLEDTGNEKVKLEFIKNKVKNLNDCLERELSKLSLVA